MNKCGVSFKVKSQIEVTLSPKELNFFVRDTNEAFSMKIDYSEEDWESVCFCANLCSTGDEI